MGRLDGKAAIVTGATSGMGRAIALLFAHEGASGTGQRPRPRTGPRDRGRDPRGRRPCDVHCRRRQPPGDGRRAGPGVHGGLRRRRPCRSVRGDARSRFDHRRPSRDVERIARRQPRVGLLPAQGRAARDEGARRIRGRHRLDCRVQGLSEPRRVPAPPRARSSRSSARRRSTTPPRSASTSCAPAPWTRRSSGRPRPRSPIRRRQCKTPGGRRR